MSDANPTQHDAAILVLRERERELDGEIQSHQRNLEIAAARRDELLDLIAMLSKRPRPRRVRPIAEVPPEPANDTAPISVFGMPSGAT